MSIRAALIGSGGWGSTHTANWKRLESEGLITFAGVCDVNPENQVPGVPFFATDDALYDAVQPDVVSIAAGIPVHRKLLLNALAHGCSVLLEKPAAATGDEVEAMKFGSEIYAGNFALIAFQFLYTPETEMLKKAILNGTYGKLQSIRVRGAVKRNDAYYNRNNWAGRIRDPRTGQPVWDSPLSNAFAHYLNLALYCAGMELERSACVEHLENVRLVKARPEIENFDSCSFRAWTREEISIDVFFSHTTAETEWPNLCFAFDSGNRIIWSPSEWIAVDPGDNVLERITFAEDPQYHMFRTVAEMAAGEAHRYGICTLETALEHTRCVELIQRYPVAIDKEAVRHEDEGGFYTNSADFCCDLPQL